VTENVQPGELAAAKAQEWATTQERLMKAQMAAGPVLATVRAVVGEPGPAPGATSAEVFAAILVADRELIGRAAAHADQAGWHTIADYLREAVVQLDRAIALTGEIT
jgi:hypothetical protein